MPYIGDVPGGQANVQQVGSLPCILAVQLKEITHLEQNHIVRVVVLYIVIGVVDGIVPHVLLIQLLFLRSQIPVFPDKGGDVLGNLRPVHLHRGTSAFGQPDALGAVIFGGMVSPGQRMRAPADAVLLLQEVRFFLHGVVCGKICVDSALATFHGAAACKRFADFILSNKALRFCKFGKPVRIYPALGRDVPDSLPQLVHPVIMKAQKFSVFRVIIQKSQKFAAKRIGKSAVLHLLRKRCGGVRITGRKIIHGGEIACLVCFITQVMFQIEQALCQFGTDTPTGFGKLHIGSKAAFF